MNDPHQSPDKSAVAEHYFSAHPIANENQLESRHVVLAGQSINVVTAPGVFSHEHLDKGTALLLETVLADYEFTSGCTVLDLGCGWGPLALGVGLSATDAISRCFALDINERAVDLTARNARSLGLDSIIATTGDEIPESTHFDLLISNPPIRIGKQALHELLHTWLTRLAPHGVAYLVVAKKLGADSLTSWLEEKLRPHTHAADLIEAGSQASSWTSNDGRAMSADVVKIAQAKGFKIIRVTRLT